MMILKEGLTHEDPSGNVHANFVAKIVKIADDREFFTVTIELKIWASDSARIAGKQPEIKIYYLSAEERDKFYSIPLLNRSGINPVAQGYIYLHSLTEWENWRSDEGEGNG